MSVDLVGLIEIAVRCLDAMLYACEQCGRGHEGWQVECDDCGGPVEERDEDR